MRILFQGDSITDGNRIKDNERDLNHQIGHSYAYIITALLSAKLWDRQLEFVNRGISGNRIVDLYARLQEDVLNVKPDVLSILIGVNDVGMQVRGGKGTPPARFLKAYRMLLDDVFEALPACRVILCEPFLLPVGQVKEQCEYWSELMKPIQKAMNLIAKEYPVVYVPLQQKFNELVLLREASYWLWDGVHPTEAGYQVIADAWLNAANKIIAQNSGGLCSQRNSVTF